MVDDAGQAPKHNKLTDNQERSIVHTQQGGQNGISN